MNTILYMTGLLTFYLKGEISTDQNFLKLKIPNTILSLIPLGSKKENVPVHQISSVSTNFKLNFKSFVLGIIVAFIGLASLSDSVVAGLLMLLYGISSVINIFQTELYVATSSGKEYYIPFLIFEKAKASQAEQLINNVIASRLNDTNNRQVAEAQTSAIVDAINDIK